MVFTNILHLTIDKFVKFDTISLQSNNDYCFK